jgi:hypothetical protein
LANQFILIRKSKKSLIKNIKSLDEEILAVKFSPNNKYICIGSGDSKFSLTKLNGDDICVFNLHEVYI